MNREKAKISGFFSLNTMLPDFERKWVANDNGWCGVYIKKVIYADPATIVFWSDDTKTVSVAHDDVYCKEAGLAICIMKKLCGASRVFDIMHDWVDEDKDIIEVKDVRKKNKK